MKVIINCAMSVDGKIALSSRHQTKISNDEDKRRVHKMRNASDAILVGVDTIVSDDPKLTVNPKYVKSPKQPLRVVLDSKGRTPRNAKVLNGEAQTIIVTNEMTGKTFPNAEVVRSGRDDVDLAKLLKILERMGIRNLMVEGGSKVIWSFLDSRLADEVCIFVGSIAIGGDKSPTMAGGPGAPDEKHIVPLRLKGAKVLGNGVLLRYEVVK